MMKMSWVLAVVAVVAMAGRAQAWMRMNYADHVVVERTELMVVGAIKEGSVVVVPHPHKGDEGRSWETRAVLVVGEVIKGECKEKELPIVIRYGLDVYVDGKQHDGSDKAVTLPVAKESLAVIDTGNSSVGGPQVAEDVRKDCVWFLRRADEQTALRWGDKGLGIEDPEDVQPVGLRGYLECYLKADAEGAVRGEMQKRPEIAERAMRFLRHREVERILKEKDAGVRVEKLLPYYQSGDWEAREGIVAAGEVAGPYLMGLYGRAKGEQRGDIIRMWGAIRYKGCVDLLIEMLKREDKFWAGQEVKAGKWYEAGEAALTQYRQDSHTAIYYGIYALQQIGEPRAREAIELTRKRWAGFGSEREQIVEACDEALKTLAKEK